MTFLVQGSALLVNSGAFMIDVPTSGTTPPGAMDAPSLTAGDTQVLVDLDNTYTLGSGTFTQWDLRHSSDEANWTEIIVFSEPFTVTGLTNGVARYFQSRVVTTDGAGPWSVSATATPAAAGGGATVPGTMLAPTLTPGDSQMGVDLREGTANGGAAISSEDIRFSIDGGLVWIERTSVADPYTITSLANGVAVLVQSRAVNSVGAGPWSASATATPAAVSIDEPDADSTVSGTSAYLALLASWNSNWNGTVPGGKTSSSPRYIDLEDGEYGRPNVNYKFPVDVYVRSKNRATHGARFTGHTGTGTDNFHLQYIWVHQDTQPGTQNYYAVRFQNATNVTLDYCVGFGPDLNPSGTVAFVRFDNGNSCHTRECYWQWWNKGAQFIGGTDCGDIGSMANLQSGDDMTFGPAAGPNVGHFCTDFWCSRDKDNLDAINPDGDHVDLVQNQSNNATDFVIRGVIALKRFNGGNGIQGMFGNGGPMNNILIEQCAIMTNNQGVKFQTSSTGTVQDCTTFTAFDDDWTTRGGDTPVSFAKISGPPTKRRNVVYSDDIASGGAGTDGRTIVGSGMAGDTAGHAEMRTLYNGPFTCGGASWMSSWMPKVGQPSHWDYPGTKIGPAERLREIFVEGLHPGNSKNLYLAARWQEVWNGNGFVTS